MKKTTRTTVFLTVLLASFFLFLPLHGVEAQTAASVSGDDLCGSATGTACNFSHFKVMIQKLLLTFVAIGGALLFLFIAFRLVQSEIAVRGGDAGARMRAGKNIFNALVGFFIVIAVFGGFFVLALKLIGTKPQFLDFLRSISESFIPHAYAVEGYLPNPTSSNNLFDLILAVVNLAIKFFIYPTIIVLWVWSGFQFVFSQGNPAGLAKAKSWLLWSFLITALVFTLQGFLFAFKNTALKIAPQNPGLNEPASGSTVTTSPDAPAPGAPGSACTTPTGQYGFVGTDRVCVSGGQR